MIANNDDDILGQESKEAMMIRLKSIYLPLIIFSLVCIASSGLRAEEQAENQLLNGTFEEADDGLPAHWKRATWSGKGQSEYTDGGHNGTRCVLLESTEGGDIAWTQIVSVVPETHYRLSGLIKTDDVNDKKSYRLAKGRFHRITDCHTRGSGYYPES